MRLKDKVAIVTGSTSGMGLEEALLFAKEGAKVAVVGRRAEAGKQVVADIKSAGGKAIFIQADIMLEGDIQKIAETVLKTYGRIDILVNNAGIFDKYAKLLDTDEELWDRVFDTNIKSIYRMNRTVLPTMIEQGGGSIVNIASVAGLIAGKGGAAYTASKHAVVGLTKHISSEYARFGIHVNAICPGTIVTPLIKDVVEYIPKDPIPVRRLGEAREVAELCLFLASDEAQFVNGAIIPIDGGFTIQ